jgi:hypothetical protein
MAIMRAAEVAGDLSTPECRNRIAERYLPDLNPFKPAA